MRPPSSQPLPEAARAQRVLRIATLALLAAMICEAPTARANLHPLTDGRGRIGERSWEDLVDPARRDARILVRQAVALLIEATHAEPDGLEPSSQLQVERALDRLDRALVARRDDVELAFYRGIALSMFVHEEASGRLERRTDEAIAEFERARALDPSYEPATIAWQLALLHTRAHRFDRASEEYDRARRGPPARIGAPIAVPTPQERSLQAFFVPPESGDIALNQAEVEMLGGELERARGHYREAVESSERGSARRALALFGQALAEERAGAHLEAIASAHEASTTWTPNLLDAELQALVARHGPVAVLHHPGVSFEPRWERHAYEALAHEALAQRASDAEAAQAERARARRALRAFFAVGGNESPYADVARQGLVRLDADDIVITARVPTSPAR
ncbi:MAG: hypothetical protein J0L92_39360 [Deltaproteobacteria bacterium]|nr:hypothetical protein [Deltaproteobacteria bacterium]